MNLFHFGQLLFGAVVLGLVGYRAWAIGFRGALEVVPWLQALARARAEGQDDRLRALLAAGRGSPVAGVAEAALGRSEEQEQTVEEALFDARVEAQKGLWSLRILGSAASALGFLGAIFELIHLLQGDHGLAGLMAGLPEKLAFEAAAVSMSIGIATSIVAFTARALLARSRRTLIADAERVAAELVTKGDDL